MILLIVLATATPNPNAAMKLKKAAKATALLGERTLVETTVEIELAESWNPFVKSKMSAMPMMTMISSQVASIMKSSRFLRSSRVPDRDIGKRICHVLAIVGRDLQVFIDILELDDGDRIGCFEQVGHRMGKHIISQVFQPVHLNAALLNVPGVLQGTDTVHGTFDLTG